MKHYFRIILEGILKFLANRVLCSRKPQIIAITGSVGKSTAKEAIYQVLKDEFKDQIWKNEGNLNEEIGVPLSILGFKHSIRWFLWPIVLLTAFKRTLFYSLNLSLYPKILILELSASKPGDIDYLVSFIKPHIGIVTAVGLAHIEFFKNLDNIIKEKRKIIEILDNTGFALLNIDDKNIKEMSKYTHAKVVYFHGNNFDSAKNIAREIGLIYRIEIKKIQKSLENFIPLKGRMNIIRGIKNTIILDDTYNANPLSMERALEKLKVLAKETKSKREIAVLGSMLELGELSKTAHQEIQKQAREITNLLITVGNNYIKEISDFHFDNSSEAASFILSKIEKGDIILVKGSRGMKMEKVVEKLR